MLAFLKMAHYQKSMFIQIFISKFFFHIVFNTLFNLSKLLKYVLFEVLESKNLTRLTILNYFFVLKQFLFVTLNKLHTTRRQFSETIPMLYISPVLYLSIWIDSKLV